MFVGSRTWNYETCFEDAPDFLDMPSSCIIGDRLYIYGGNAKDDHGRQKDIFEYEFGKHLRNETNFSNLNSF